MRFSRFALILTAAFLPLTAQQPPRSVQVEQDSGARQSAATATAEPATTGSTPQPAAEPLASATVDSLRRLVRRFREDPEGVRLPADVEISMGGRTVPADTSVDGPVVVAGGPLHVHGTVTGDAIAVAGDVVVHAGGRVTGNAVAAHGDVVLSGGTIGGELRELRGVLGAVAARAATPAPAAGRTRHAVALAASSLVIMVLIGIGVLVFAGAYLDGVVEALEGRFARSFWAGIAAQVAIVPVLLLIVVALALTIIGILAIPLAIVLFVLAVAGVVTLGFLAVAQVTGESVSPGANARLHPRGAALRAMIVGVTIYMGIWVLAAVFAWAPVVETVLRGIAVAITWVAATAGLGAAVISRGGTRRAMTTTETLAAVNDPVWQTPTPVSGVVAARRPTPASSSRSP